MLRVSSASVLTLVLLAAPLAVQAQAQAQAQAAPTAAHASSGAAAQPAASSSDATASTHRYHVQIRRGARVVAEHDMTLSNNASETFGRTTQQPSLTIQKDVATPMSSLVHDASGATPSIDEVRAVAPDVAQDLTDTFGAPDGQGNLVASSQQTQFVPVGTTVRLRQVAPGDVLVMATLTAWSGGPTSGQSDDETSTDADPEVVSHTTNRITAQALDTIEVAQRVRLAPGRSAAIAINKTVSVVVQSLP